jgi:hypothetical protein
MRTKLLIMLYGHMGNLQPSFKLSKLAYSMNCKVISKISKVQAGRLRVSTLPKCNCYNIHINLSQKSELAEVI